MNERLLLHSCCGPCTTGVLPALQHEGFDVSGFFFNPNIHPFDEYARRLEAMQGFLAKQSVPLVIPFPYNPLSFFSALSGEERRCTVCYTLRLEQTARWARDRGFSCFSTTLTISPYQDIPAIHRIGKQLEWEYGVGFIARDFRDGFSRSQELARKYDLYRQKYCGCIYSLWEGVNRSIWKTLINGGAFS